MRIGDRGDDVKNMQELLIKNDFVIKADGFFGDKTEVAVKAFQAKNSLTPDGVVGPLTLAKLNRDKVADISVKVYDGGSADLDARTLRNLATLDPKARDKFQAFIKEAKSIAASYGYEYIALSGTRNEQEQNSLYAQGRSKPGQIVTNAKFGYSSHNFSIALDFGVFKNGQYIDDKNPNESTRIHTAVSKIADKHGIDWGGNWVSFKDTPHFEIKTGLTMGQKRALFAKKGSIL